MWNQLTWEQQNMAIILAAAIVITVVIIMGLIGNALLMIPQQKPKVENPPVPGEKLEETIKVLAEENERRIPPAWIKGMRSFGGQFISRTAFYALDEKTQRDLFRRYHLNRINESLKSIPNSESSVG